ncbi:MAG: hypothetical protein AAFO77_08510, partial [Pseudomonadota bacterium]
MHRRRAVQLVCAAALWLLVGMALPLIPGSTTTRAPIDTGQVNAAPRHTLVIHDEPIAIAPEIGLTIGKGTIKIADDDAANGQTADHDSNIASGKAGFVASPSSTTKPALPEAML